MEEQKNEKRVLSIELDDEVKKVSITGMGSDEKVVMKQELDETLDILIHHDDEQQKEQANANVRDRVHRARRDDLAPYPLVDLYDEPAAIERRNREQIHDSERNRQHRNERQETR